MRVSLLAGLALLVVGCLSRSRREEQPVTESEGPDESKGFIAPRPSDLVARKLGLPSLGDPNYRGYQLAYDPNSITLSGIFDTTCHWRPEHRFIYGEGPVRAGCYVRVKLSRRPSEVSVDTFPPYCYTWHTQKTGSEASPVWNAVSIEDYLKGNPAPSNCQPKDFVPLSEREGDIILFAVLRAMGQKIDIPPRFKESVKVFQTAIEEADCATLEEGERVTWMSHPGDYVGKQVSNGLSFFPTPAAAPSVLVTGTVVKGNQRKNRPQTLTIKDDANIYYLVERHRLKELPNIAVK